MNKRRSVLYILLTALGLILIYNYFIVPYFMQYNTYMGMGMHGRVTNYSNYYIDPTLIILIVLFATGLILYDFLSRSKALVKKCGKCGQPITSDRWKICPFCGTPVKKGGSGNR